ncbi:hypothetical protein L1049_011211 [Liquidambar formosana]|uniref:Uncharacterized protein n=1 Tax=Liquidambar formosana TaxID=63359 RepID=A0AAP0WWV6_LIQFO
MLGVLCARPKPWILASLSFVHGAAAHHHWPVQRTDSFHRLRGRRRASSAPTFQRLPARELHRRRRVHMARDPALRCRPP